MTRQNGGKVNVSFTFDIKGKNWRFTNDV